ncbi:MAG: hypothetical protein GY715_08260 [Planctomycetes bacterium]|nr:hypothetical protein [Planctomycetota bacterium]
MWHEATKAFREDGRIQMVGIVQEQHPDRARLFMQWKQMDWPILVDSFNELDVKVVPITMLIDEHGIIRDVRPPRRDIAATVERFVNTRYEPPAGEPATVRSKRPAIEAAYWGGANGIDQSVGVLRRAVEESPGDGRTHFRYGVALRRRYESLHRRPGDFATAVEQWQRALAIDPNQYIWRRRIQQYGPRLGKPYPFYDWVERARREIRGRGEEPRPLSVEPSGAEIAHPLRNFEFDPARPPEPDPKGLVTPDDRFISIEATIVPATAAPGETVRVHLHLRPAHPAKASWNNEAEDLIVWLDPRAGWRADRRQRSWPRPKTEVSSEPRTLEFELRVPGDAKPGVHGIRAYAVYNVCEGEDATCLYRRQDVPIRVRVREK